MNTRRFVLTGALICCLAIAVGGGPLGAAPANGKGGFCRLAGTWRTTNPDTGSVFFDTLSAMDPAEKKLAYVSQWVNEDPSFGGFFPADGVTLLRGEMVRTGRATGNYSLLAYGTVDVGFGLPKEIVYAAVISGPFEVLDCGTIFYDAGTLSIFMPWQDPFGEEPPELCLPFTPLTSTRVEAAPMCEVIPP